MKIAVMQPYFLPYFGYLQLLNAVDKFIILDDVNYISKGWINRNRILVNNKDFTFTIPLQEASQNKLIADIELANDAKWKSKLLKTISLNYKKAICFNEVYPVIESVVSFEEQNLSKYILNSLTTICKYLDINTVIVPDSSVYNSGHLKASDKILDICLQESATVYINPIGGIELYEKEKFLQNNIQLNFLQSDKFEYKQFGGPDFIPWLSVIDVLMFNSKPEIKKNLLNYTLI